MQGAVTYQIGQHVGFVDLIDRSEEDKFRLSETAEWFCAVTNPNCQARATMGLYELGYRTFYPKAKRWVSHARVRKAKEAPVLGRYIFVEVDPKNDRQSFHDVRSVNGVESLVGPMGIPTPFPQRWVDDLRSRYMAGEWDEVAKEHFPVGARIRIVEGEFADMLATVTNRKGNRLDFKFYGENRYGRLNECSVRAA
jgi:transcription antitermination factor NusG